MNNIIKSSLFVCLTALVLPAYAADTGMSNTAMAAGQQGKSASVKEVTVRHYRHHHHHYHHCSLCHRYHHRHHGARYEYYTNCSHRHMCGCRQSCCPTNLFYRSGCCPTNVFYRGCGCNYC